MMDVFMRLSFPHFYRQRENFVIDSFLISHLSFVIYSSLSFVTHYFCIYAVCRFAPFARVLRLMLPWTRSAARPRGWSYDGSVGCW